jgi:hypothetical protein
MDAGAIWEQYREQYGAIPAEAVRVYLEEHGVLLACEKQGRNVALVRREVERFEAAQVPRHPRSGVIARGDDLGRAALSEIQAIEARRDDDLRSFRHDVLKGRLLRHDEVAAWVLNLEAGTAPTFWVEVPLPASVSQPATPDGFTWEWLAGAAMSAGAESERPPRVNTRTELVAYPGTAGADEQAAVSLGSPLWRLKRLAARLSTTYEWREAAAVAFILTDAAPVIPLGAWGVGLTAAPGGCTIQLHVRPQVTQKEVGALYQTARSALYAMSGNGGRERNPIVTNERTRDLAVFAAATSDRCMTWPDAMREWNTSRGEEESDPQRFGRDCRNAYERVTGSRLPTRSNTQGQVEPYGMSNNGGDSDG